MLNNERILREETDENISLEMVCEVDGKEYSSGKMLISKHVAPLTDFYKTIEDQLRYRIETKINNKKSSFKLFNPVKDNEELTLSPEAKQYLKDHPDMDFVHRMHVVNEYRADEDNKNKTAKHR